jgi:hypothetical protein
MCRHSWPGITTDILEVTLTPSNKMRVMYKANLNFERFNRYFYDLLRKGFIEEKTVRMGGMHASRSAELAGNATNTKGYRRCGKCKGNVVQ